MIIRYMNRKRERNQHRKLILRSKNVHSSQISDRVQITKDRFLKLEEIKMNSSRICRNTKSKKIKDWSN